MMASHPQTLYGLVDSPVALAAWLIDHDAFPLVGDLREGFKSLRT